MAHSQPTRNFHFFCPFFFCLQQKETTKLLGHTIQDDRGWGKYFGGKFRRPAWIAGKFFCALDLDIHLFLDLNELDDDM